MGWPPRTADPAGARAVSRGVRGGLNRSGRGGSVGARRGRGGDRQDGACAAVLRAADRGAPDPVGRVRWAAHRAPAGAVRRCRGADRRPARGGARRGRAAGGPWLRGAPSRARSHRPTIVVLEDLQWADEATLDIVLMLGRRVPGVRALTIATYRDDGLTANDPLRSAIGELGARFGVRPARRVAALARRGRAAGERGRRRWRRAARRTAGNPFFVSEVLAAGGGEIPATVRDAVLARAARLSAPARQVLDALAVVPQPVEVPLLEELLGDAIAHVDACLAWGMLQSERRAVAFRHDLARLAVEEAIPAHRAVALHRNVLAALRAWPGVDAARLALPCRGGRRHAGGARVRAGRRGPRVLARRASRGGGAVRAGAAVRGRARAGRARRAAQAPLARVPCDRGVRRLDRVDRGRAGLLSRPWRPREEGAALRLLANTLHCIGGREQRAARAARAAIEVLEQFPPGPELARAYGFMSSLQRDHENADEASPGGARANELAERFGDVEMRIRSLMDIGTMEFLLARPGGAETLEQALELARSHGYEDRAGVIFINLAWAATRIREYDRADEYVRAGREYCTARDLEVHRFYLFAYRARVELDRGRWADAAESASPVTRDRRSAPYARAPALAVLGLVRARRGDPDPWSALDEARALTLSGGALQRPGPVAAARAETLWLEGRTAEVDAATASTLALALERGAAWVVGELACWRRRAGLRDELPGRRGGGSRTRARWPATTRVRRASGAASAAPTRRRWRSPTPTTRPRSARRMPTSRRSGRCRRRRSSRDGCTSAARAASRVAPTRGRATTPAGSPRASLRCSSSSPAGSTTARSPSASSCRGGPSTRTSPRSCASSMRGRAARRAPRPSG